MAVLHTFYLTKVNSYGEPISSTITFQATTAKEWREKALKAIMKDLRAINPNYSCGKEERDDGLKGVYYFTPINKDKTLTEEKKNIEADIKKYEKKIETQRSKDAPNYVLIQEFQNKLDDLYEKLDNIEGEATVPFFYILENVEFCLQNNVELVGKVA